MIRDRDGKFPGLSDAVLQDAGIETVLSGIQMPRMRAYAERWVRTVRAGVTDRMLIAGPRHLRAVLEGTSRTTTAIAPHRARNLRPPDCDDITMTTATDLTTGAPSIYLRCTSDSPVIYLAEPDTMMWRSW